MSAKKADEAAPAPVIRIVKKVSGHGGHHGGAWKVAYADFVTAMMAFFLVMWIISMDQSTREEIQDYFRNPMTSSETGISKFASGGSNPTATGFAGIMQGRTSPRMDVDTQMKRFRSTEKALAREMRSQPSLSRLARNVQMWVDETGLMIELVESSQPLFFESGSARVPADAAHLLGLIAGELGKLPNSIIVEGHTDREPFARGATYSNWELSADRANAARRLLEANGVRPSQVLQVRGYADQQLRMPDDPTHYTNRRVAIRVAYREIDPVVAEPGIDDGIAMRPEVAPRLKAVSGKEMQRHKEREARKAQHAPKTPSEAPGHP
jgi:chemotaxis protein MotB